jgi:hypothetical protein
MTKAQDQSTLYHYQNSMSRRDSLKWLSILAASAALPGITSCSPSPEMDLTAQLGHWPNIDATFIDVKGYGKDPNLIIPPRTAWPRILSEAQLNLVAVLSDILLPRQGELPSASEIKVPEVIDEWVSAPYQSQQRDRPTILATLAWLDDEANLRFQQTFVASNAQQRMAIIDNIAFDRAELPAQFQRITQAFSRFRQLVMAAYCCSPQGSKELGYMGNVPIAGDYPGPSDEAKQHLEKILGQLGLTEFAYQV